MANGTTPKTTPDSEKSKDTKMREAYSAATKRVREDNREVFNKYMTEEAKARGIDWTPKPTAAEKARAEFQRLLSEHPEFASEVGGTAEGEDTVPA